MNCIQKSNTEEQQILLSELPTELNISFVENTYTLICIVDFKSSKIQTEQSLDFENIGHYTAICRRRNNKWIKYNNCKDSEKVLDNNFSTCPHIAIYSI